MVMLSLKNLDAVGRTVLLRSDLNVPLDLSGNIEDEERITQSLPTIKWLLERKCKLVIMGHLGRPKGARDESLSFRPVALRLSELLGQKVELAPDCIGPEVKKLVDSLKEGQALLLENLRFNPGEKVNDEKFAKELAKLGEVYVDDAFGNAHRADASMEAITRVLPSYSGLLMEKEIEVLRQIFSGSGEGVITVIGGSKGDKIEAVEALADRCDKVLIGGAMIFTFFRALGLETGRSLVDEDCIERAKKLVNNEKIKTPFDVVVAPEKSNDTPSKVVNIDEIPKDEYGLDIGTGTVSEYIEWFDKAKFIIWSGPMGLFEIDQFSKGTERIARAIAKSEAMTIVGGADTIAAIKKFGLIDAYDHVSTGGGAMLEYLKGVELPAIKALEAAANRAK